MSDEARDALLDLIDRRRAQLQQDAIGLGRRLYAETPAAFGRRFRDYWRVWRQEVQSVQR